MSTQNQLAGAGRRAAPGNCATLDSAGDGRIAGRGTRKLLMLYQIRASCEAAGGLTGLRCRRLRFKCLQRRDKRGVV